ncbi:Clp1, partial [Ophiophagus hannah]
EEKRRGCEEGGRRESGREERKKGRRGKKRRGKGVGEGVGEAEGGEEEWGRRGTCLQQGRDTGQKTSYSQEVSTPICTTQ